MGKLTTSDSVDFIAVKHEHKVTLEKIKVESPQISLVSLISDTASIGTLFLTNKSELNTYIKKSRGKDNPDIIKANLNYINWKNCRSAKIFSRNYLLLKSPEIGFGRANFVISDGKINSLSIQINDNNGRGMYVNKGPISITNLNKLTYYRLDYRGSNIKLKETHLILGDLMNYLSEAQRSLIPSDTSFSLDLSSSSIKLKSDYNPSKFFVARVYTDTKGLSGQNNGLVQSDLSARFFGNTTPLSRSYFTFCQFVSLSFTYSKFDSKYDTLRLPSLVKRSPSELLKLVQNSNSGIRIEIDLFRYSRVHEGYISIGHSLLSTKVSSIFDSTYARVFTPAFYAVLGGSLHAGRLINAHFRIPVQLVYTADQPFKQYTKKSQILISPELELSVKLNSKSTKVNNEDTPYVFGRVRYYDLPDFSENNFWQIQLGIQVPLNKIFN